jgi:hypothetical protein
MRFLVTFLLATGAIALLYGACVIVLDPRADFGTGLVPPLTLESRRDKMRLFMAHHEESPVQGIVLGSSRCFKFRPDRLGEIYGQRFFNFSVGGAMAEDLLAIYRWARLQGARPATLVVGMDPTILYDQEMSHRAFTSSGILNLALDDQLGTMAYVSLFAGAFATDYAADILRSGLLMLRSSRQKDPALVFEADGFTREPRYDEARRAGTFDLEEAVGACMDEAVRTFTMNSLSEKRYGHIETLVKEATADGARVKILLTTNYAPAVDVRMRKGTPYSRLHEELRGRLQDLAVRYDTELYDFSDLESYGGSPEDWSDCSHIGEQNAEKILEELDALDS